ncbi:MAG: hypothetical protein KKF89_00930, partial [Nanoarchaeota archaeon]|nr:hypothetical protein [Nanoarchaeota archaeon]MBU1854261.1 hypothetical protein [Nanoarchaeota archaeon]
AKDKTISIEHIDEAEEKLEKEKVFDIIRTQPKKTTIIGIYEKERLAPEDLLFAEFLKSTIKGEKTNIDEVREKIQKGVTAEYMRTVFGDKIQRDIDFCLNYENREFNVVPKLYHTTISDALKH